MQTDLASLSLYERLEADFDASTSIISDAGGDANYIKSIVKTGGRLVILIDIFKVIGQDTLTNFSKTSAA